MLVLFFLTGVIGMSQINGEFFFHREFVIAYFCFFHLLVESNEKIEKFKRFKMIVRLFKKSKNYHFLVSFGSHSYYFFVILYYQTVNDAH